MNRRTFLRASAGLTGSMTLAGCAGLFSVRQGEPPLVENRPKAVYYPTHSEGMKMLGTGERGSMSMNESGSTGGMNDTSRMAMNSSGGSVTNNSTGESDGRTSDYAFALMYSYPHRFWTVTGSRAQKVPIQQDDSVHLMASVWEPQTGIVLPDTGLSVEINQGNTLVSEEAIYPMLSQQMGFHYGANFALPGDGTYTATLSVGAMSTRRTGEFVGMFGKPTSVDIQFEYSQQEKNEIAYTRLEERAGKQGAVEPMAMKMLPNSTMPTKRELPGEVIGTQTSGDGRFVVTVLDEPPRGIDANGPYLAVTARTPYNRMVLPAMGLSATFRRKGKLIFDGPLKPALDPNLNYHYGATVDSVKNGDRLEVRTKTPPQAARHEGYETAFLDMPLMLFTI